MILISFKSHVIHSFISFKFNQRNNLKQQNQKREGGRVETAWCTDELWPAGEDVHHAQIKQEAITWRA